MATQTDKLAPRILINEHDLTSNPTRRMNPPITLIFGFAPVGRVNEMVVCNNDLDIHREFGYPQSTPEKYFIDAGLRLVRQGATALMTRLPYDNEQSHMVKYVDYKVESPISMRDIATVPAETKTRQKDDTAVTILKEMHAIDPRMTQVQRVVQVKDNTGLHIGSMTCENLVELELDPQANLEKGTIRIVDIRSDQYGVGAGKQQYTGVFPVFVSAPLALYCQGMIQNSDELDEKFRMIDLNEGIEMSTKWYRNSNPVHDDVKKVQAEIIASISQVVNLTTKGNRFRRNLSFQESCAKRFPNINLLSRNQLEKTNLKKVGLLLCRIGWDSDTQTTSLEILESYVGQLGHAKNSIDRQINAKSKFIRMYKNLSIPVETDFFVVDNQKITSLGMDEEECLKYINLKTSILDPIEHVLQSVYSDVDSVFIDTILDAGLSSIAFAAYVARTEDGETFDVNPKVRTRVDWSKTSYPPESYIIQYARIWNKLTRLFGDFIKSVRGDCVYIADGPRIANLERNYPIRNYTDMENMEMFNKFLPLFNGYTNNYVARYWNWVYIEDMQYANMGFWVPGSVVMGSQLASSDGNGQVWFAPAGASRGVIEGAYDASVKTKQYNQENDLLYSNQWNFFNIYQNTGVVVEGQKTLQTKKTALDRLNVRRMVCWIKQQLRKISNRYKYEPHTVSVREGFRRDIVEMLNKVQSTVGISDFKVLCDTSNNTTETIDRHELWCKVAIKPIRSIEYIIIDLNVINGSVGMSESSSAVAMNRG